MLQNVTAFSLLPFHILKYGSPLLFPIWLTVFFIPQKKETKNKQAWKWQISPFVLPVYDLIILYIVFLLQIFLGELYYGHKIWHISSNFLFLLSFYVFK